MAATLLTMFVGVRPAVAEEETCESDFGTKVPMLMVHGFNSNPRMWSDGTPSLEKVVVGSLGNVHIARPFDYESTHFEWVTHSSIGPKLAATIDCLAQASRKNGGAGKVIVVTHSMGGLATRFAANQTVEGRSVAGEIGLVIALGGPFLGSPWSTKFGSGWRWYCGVVVDSSRPNRSDEIKKCEKSAAITGMTEASDELRSLPKFPLNIPVRVIAGRVRVTVQFFFTTITQPLTDDTAVPVSSASDGFTGTGHGDGKFVFDCSLHRYDSTQKFAGGECSHNEMYKTGYIQESVTNGVKEYLATLAGSGCISLQEANSVNAKARAHTYKAPDVIPQITNVACDSDWAIARSAGVDGVVLFQRKQGVWTYYSVGSYWKDTRACGVVSPGIRKQLLGCNN